MSFTWKNTNLIGISQRFEMQNQSPFFQHKAWQSLIRFNKLADIFPPV